VLVILSLGSILKIGFERPYLLGNVLVKGAASVISTYVYNVGLLSARHDFATAVGLFQSGIGIVMVLAADFFSKKFGEEGIL
jgi:putative aldouronate transport system permease protein